MRISHMVGFDDAPFEPTHRGDVLLIGAVFSGPRLEGVLSGKVRRDGINSTNTVIHLIDDSRFAEHLQAVLLQGIAFAGFNVVDLMRLHNELKTPIIAIARKEPDMGAIKRALLAKVPGGKRKWRLLERLEPMKPLEGVFVQCIGISLPDTGALIRRTAINSNLPEPLRTAHLIAGGVSRSESRHRA